MEGVTINRKPNCNLICACSSPIPKRGKIENTTTVAKV